MALSAYNIATCSFTEVKGELKGSITEWSNSAFFYTGCSPHYSYNYVVVIRFTLDKYAKNVVIPVKSSSTNSSSSSALLCYGLGNEPDPNDSSTINVTSNGKAIGTFYFKDVHTTTTINLNNVKPGTNFLYIWGEDPSVYSLTNIEVSYTYATGITYEKLDGLVYIDNGSGFEPYECYIDNGTDWDLCVPYIDNGTSWDICC